MASKQDSTGGTTPLKEEAARARTNGKWGQCANLDKRMSDLNWSNAAERSDRGGGRVLPRDGVIGKKGFRQ
jgi:hypothetical protein